MPGRQHAHHRTPTLTQASVKPGSGSLLVVYGEGRTVVRETLPARRDDWSSADSRADSKIRVDWAMSTFRSRDVATGRKMADGKAENSVSRNSSNINLESI